MSKTVVTGSILMLLASAVLFACSCGSKQPDSPFDPSNIGSVSIVVTPSALSAPWTLTGPVGTTRSGSGTDAIGSLPAGAYTVTWGQVDGYATPLPDSGILSAGGVLTLAGAYVQLEPGTISIGCMPAELQAPWRLEWNGGTSFVTGLGASQRADMPAGDYVIFWLALAGWYQPSPDSQAFTLEPGGEFHVAGIWSPVPPGSVQVNPEPHDLGASWTLNGPWGYQTSGVGRGVVSSLPAGTYSLQWGAVAGWTSPAPALTTGELSAGGVLVFSGTYVQVPPVTVNVDVAPDTVAAEWTLTGPGGFTATRSGDWSIGGLLAGQYAILWGNAGSGWYNPSPIAVSAEIASGASHTFSAVYTAIPGVAVTVDVVPNTITAPWTLTGPGDYLMSRSGDWSAHGLEPGHYLITWGDAGAGWVMPSPASLSHTLSPGGAHTFSGVYTEILPVTIAVDVTPNTITAQWTVTGPGGFSVVRAGDWSQSGLAPGQYSISWASAGSDWTTPSPASVSRTVPSGGSTVFAGTYTAITRIGIFAESGGAVLASEARWDAWSQATVHILLLNPDPSGVAYWDARLTYSGSNTVLQNEGVAAGSDSSPYANTFRVTMPSGLPLLPNDSNVCSVGWATFYCGSRSLTSIYLAPVSEIGYNPATPIHSTGAMPGLRLALEPYNGSWSAPAFVIRP